MSLALMKAHALTAQTVGPGYRPYQTVSSETNPKTPAPGSAGLLDADQGCDDIWQSLNGDALTGGVAAARFYDVTFDNSKVNQWITEWIGAYSGDGAQQALANLSRDATSCKRFGTKDPHGSVAEVMNRPYPPPVTFGAGRAGYLMTVRSEKLNFTASVARFGSNIVGVSVTTPIIVVPGQPAFTPYRSVLESAEIHVFQRLLHGGATG